MGSTVAIDFGTTNTVVAEWIEASRSPETIVLDGLSYRLQGGPPAVPSIVYVDDVASGAYRVGFAVLSQGLQDTSEAASRFHSSMKRDLLGDRPQSGALPAHRLLTSGQAAEVFLTSVARAVLATGRNISELVLTAPVMSFEVYLRWLVKTVCGNNTFPDVPLRIIDEPTAAAFGYGIDQPDGHVLVIDFGGGTLDLSLVHLPEDFDTAGRGIVIAPGTDPESTAARQRDRIRGRVVAKGSCGLGGDTIDETLIDFLLEGIGLTRGMVQNDLPYLKRTAEEAKMELSTAEGCEIHAYLKTQKRFINRTLTRDEFERQVLNAPALDALNTLRRQVDQLLKQAEPHGIGPNQIDWVLLVGGTTLIPAVRRLVEERFAPERIKQQRPFEAVAHGALALVKSCPIDDILHHSYALEVKRVQVVKKPVTPPPPQPVLASPSPVSSRPSLLGFLGKKVSKPVTVAVTPPPPVTQVSVIQSTQYEYMILIPSGTIYPLENPVPLPNYLHPPHDGATQIDFVVAEISVADTAGPREVLDSKGRILTDRGSVNVERAQTVRLLSDKRSVRLDPPGKLAESDRLDLSFNVDENRQLRLTVLDRVAGRYLLYDDPVAKLE